MGDDQSEWTGVYYENSADITATTTVAMLPINVSDAVVELNTQADILQYAQANSDFKGTLQFTQTADASAVDGLTVKIQRQSLENEQTLDNGSFWRIERFRSLNGKYYNKSGNSVSFSTEL